MLKIISKRGNSTPLNLKYKQLAIISAVAMIIAASPPNSRNERKTIESEKLRMNFERGKAMLMRGAIRIVKRKRTANFHVKTCGLTFSKASKKQTKPSRAIEIL